MISHHFRGTVTTDTGTTHVHTTYDPNGNALTVTDPNGNTVTNTYDPLNRLVSTLDAENILTQFAYDSNGNRTEVIDGEGQTTRFEYDGLNRNTRIDYPAGVQDLENQYDATHLIQRIDGNGVTNYSYDAFNRLQTVSYDNGATRDYTYDKAGRILTVTESSDTRANVAYTYDSWGRQTGETSHGVTHTYTYDLADNRTKVQYGLTGQTIESTYDARNRLTFLTENGRTTQYGYDRSGRVTRKYLANGQLVKSTYDAQGRRTSNITHGPGTGGSEGPIIYQKEQIEDFTTPGTFRTRTVHNGYDNLYRLQSETITDDGSLSLTEYDYDDANNRTARRKDTDGDGNWDETADYDYTGGWNQLQYYTEEDTNGNVLRAVNFLYDANGNRSERNAIIKTYNPDNSVASTTTENDVYSWDKENRLTGVIDDIGGSSNTYAYAYDYRTRRIVRDESAGVDNQGNPGVSTSLVFSGGTSTQEWESPQLTSAQSTGAISGSARPDVTFVRGSDWGGGVGGVLYSLRADTGTTNYSAGFNFYNSRGDVIAKTDDTGAFTWQGEYQADGTRTHEVGENKDRQRGNTKDEDPTGLLCEGMRYRDLETMTFLSRDPAGFVDGPNLYCYVNQNPWTKFDPLGLEETGFADRVKMVTGFSVAFTVNKYRNEMANYGKFMNGFTSEPDNGTGFGGYHTTEPRSFERAGQFVRDCWNLALLTSRGEGAPRGGGVRGQFATPDGVSVATSPATARPTAGASPIPIFSGMESGENGQEQSSGDDPSGGAKSGKKKQSTESTPQQRGRESEKRVLEDLGEGKNTEKLTSSEGNTIPDFQNKKQVGEIKDTKSVSNTKQLRAQKEAAERSGREHVTVTGTNTNVTENAAQGTKVIRRDDLGPKN